MKKGDTVNSDKVKDWAKGFFIKGKKRFHPYTFKQQNNGKQSATI